MQSKNAIAIVPTMADMHGMYKLFVHYLECTEVMRYVYSSFNLCM